MPQFTVGLAPLTSKWREPTTKNNQAERLAGVAYMAKVPKEKQRLNVWIDPALIKRLKSKAALQGQTLSDFVEAGLKKLAQE